MPEIHAMTEPKDRIFVALDTPEVERAARLAEALRGAAGGVKVGQELFTAQGPDGVRAVAGGERLFLDLKFHDIPNTVAGAVRASVHLRPHMLTLHASGGRAMMQAAAAGTDYLVIGRPITAQPDPLAAARRIVDELAAAAGAET
jgi:orotidine-5'-phosphate decarboxylase